MQVDGFARFFVIIAEKRLYIENVF